METVQQGETIVLKGYFYDINGFLTNPTDLVVSIYPYGKNPALAGTLEADAVVLDQTPDNIGLGSYEYEFVVPEGSQVGVWYVKWEGTIGSSTVISHTQFQVLANSSDPFPHTQYPGVPVLLQNTLYTLELDGVESLDGDVLEPVTYWFTSEYDPMCTSYEVIAARLSGLVGNLNEDTVNFLIHVSTLEAQSQIPVGVTPCNADYLKFACKQYVETAVMLNIINSLIFSPGALKAKQLGDLKVTYQDNIGQITNNLGKLLKDLDGWGRVLNAAGCITFGMSVPMNIAHPGLYNPDRPPVGRQVKEPIGSGRAANTKSLLPGRTRYQHSYDIGRQGVIDPIVGVDEDDWHSN